MCQLPIALTVSFSSHPLEIGVCVFFFLAPAFFSKIKFKFSIPPWLLKRNRLFDDVFVLHSLHNLLHGGQQLQLMRVLTGGASLHLVSVRESRLKAKSENGLFLTLSPFR